MCSSDLAVINDRVYYIDNDSSARPSARITLALQQMSQALYQGIRIDEQNGKTR